MQSASSDLKDHSRTFSIYQPIDKVFGVLNDVEEYQSFIPFCIDSRIIEQNNNEIKASLILSFMGSSSEFISRNKYESNEYIEMNLVEGPFSYFKGTWFFESISDEETKLIFKMSYTIENPITDLLFSKNIDVVSQRIVEAFKKKIEG
jgi:ribosome-associated toxin RatA of RatAB toxin-antitoxin module